MSWSMVQRVRFGDLDAMQHLNNVEFLRFFETARIEYFMEKLPEHTPGERSDFGFIFGECKITYRSPGRFHDDVRTHIRPSKSTRSTLTLDFEMRVEGDGRLLAEGYGVLVGYDYVNERATELPDGLLQRLDMVAPDG